MDLFYIFALYFYYTLKGNINYYKILFHGKAAVCRKAILRQPMVHMCTIFTRVAFLSYFYFYTNICSVTVFTAGATSQGLKFSFDMAGGRLFNNFQITSTN